MSTLLIIMDLYLILPPRKIFLKLYLILLSIVNKRIASSKI